MTMRFQLDATRTGLVLLLAGSLAGPAGAETVTLREGKDGYQGCTAVTLWGEKVKKPNPASPEALYLRGNRNVLLLKFNLPDALKSRKLAQAKLEVFVPSARKLRMIAETACREVLEPWGKDATWTQAAAGKPWSKPGGAFDETTDYKRGRPAGVLDSYELWENTGQYFPHKYKFLGVPEGGKWLDFNVTPAAKKWLENPANNKGLALQNLSLGDARFPNTVEIDIPSPEAKNAEWRPRLALEFEPLPKPYLVGMTHTLERFCDYSTRYRFFGPFDEAYELPMARNEFEGFQVLVYPLGEPLKGVVLEWTDMVDGKTGAKIPKADIVYNRLETFMLNPNLKVQDWYFHGKNFRVADPLIWDKPADLEPQMSTPFWVTVRTRPETPGGTYTGTVTVKPANAPPRALKLTVRVWNYKIPEKWNFETMGSMSWGAIKQHTGKYNPEIRRKYIDFLIDHRLTPTEQYNNVLSPALDDLPYCIQRGTRTIYLSGNYTGNPDKLKERYEAVKKLGLIDNALVYIGDETSKWDEMRKRSDEIRKLCPELMIMIGGSYPRAELDGIIDIYDPQISHEAKKGATYALNATDAPPKIKESQARGEKFFWYVAAGPMLPSPNVQMEDPLIAARVLFWITWKFGVSGFEYYCYNIWDGGQPKAANPWPNAPFSPKGWGRGLKTNGDGMLFYPGPDGPCSSVRLENIRDGIEDWESHYVLRDYVEALRQKIEKQASLKAKAEALLAKGEALLKVPDEVTKMDFTSWTWEPEVLLKARKDLGDTIEACTALVTEPEMLAVRTARQQAELQRQREMLKARAAAAMAHAPGANGPPKTPENK